MIETQLKNILLKHRQYLTNDPNGDGECADLRNVNLCNADLSGANLSDANLSGADLRNVNLSYADLCGADLRDANLNDANLSYAALSGANLSYANLCDADLYNANLRDAALCNAALPSPTMVLSAQWGECSRLTTTELMRLDASAHPKPDRFVDWANGGSCPYIECVVQRIANFKEIREWYKPGPPPSIWAAMVMVLSEHCKWEPK